MNDYGSPVLARILEAMPDAAEETHANLGDATIVINATHLLPVMQFLRDDEALVFEMLTDVTAVDYLGRSPRFEMVYHLYSVTKNHRLRVKSGVSEGSCEIESLCETWPSANWMEREVFDMYGIVFRGHPDLRRILLYDEFQGHPLRKDYPKERRQPLVGPSN